MTAIRAVGVAAFLTASAASPVFAATTSYGPSSAGHTTTPTSPTMSSPNVPSHDGNAQLGYGNGTRAASRPPDNPGSDQAGNTSKDAGNGTSDPSAGPGCGLGC